MKLLLDESIPKRLAKLLPDDFETRTVPQLGWAGTRNGELLAKAADAGYDALITADQGMEHQQNPSALRLRVVVLVAPRTRLQELAPLIPQLIELLARESAPGIYRVPA